jgi:hypothetical protein
MVLNLLGRTHIQRGKIAAEQGIERGRVEGRQVQHLKCRRVADAILVAGRSEQAFCFLNLIPMAGCGLREQKKSASIAPRALAGIASAFRRIALLCSSLRSTNSWNALPSATPRVPSINS